MSSANPANPSMNKEEIFAKVGEWTPAQFRDELQKLGVPYEEVRQIRSPQYRDTLLHRAIETGNVDVARMLVNKPYLLDPKVENGQHQSALDLAIQKGGDFDGIFKDFE